MLAALAFVLAIAPPETLELSRGQSTPNGLTYWGAEDTYLEGGMPDESDGGALTLLGGPTRTILLKFGDLDRFVPANKKIVGAKIILVPLGPKPALGSASRVKAPWHEGPVKPLSFEIFSITNPTKAATPPSAPRWSSTWRSRRAGEPGLLWQQAGANGPSDSEPISAVHLESEGDAVALTGLGPTFERMHERWWENQGIALSFPGTAEFFSSESETGRPKLVLELEDAPAKSGPDLSVSVIEESISGDNRTYTARVRNIGGAPANGFAYSWFSDERAGSTIDQPQTLAPGQETSITLKRTAKRDDTDHRVHPIGFRAEAKDDVNPGNNFLEVQQDGFGLDVTIPKDVAANIPGDPADWVQSMVRVWNNVYSPMSRYSFAPDGALERVRIARITVGDAPAEAAGDSAVVVQAEQANTPGFLKAIGRALGLMDLGVMNVLPGSGRVAIPDFAQGTTDRFAGVMGGGDTRYDGTVPGSTWLPYEPRAVPIFDAIAVTATNLLAASDVATLNANLANQGAARRHLGPLPKLILFKATDSAGVPLAGAEVNFFQSNAGKIEGKTPAFTVATNDSGVAILPTKADGPFDTILGDGSNGLLLARVSKGSAVAYNWLKAWQLADSFSRGSAATVLIELPFSISTEPLTQGTDLAANKLLTDSAETSSAKLGVLVNGSGAVAVDLPKEKDGWVEVDLGRDRTIGEITLLARTNEMWNRFSIVVYATGQNAAQATVWAQETDWGYTATNRSEKLVDVRPVAYRGTAKRIRYVRIVNKIGGPGQLRAVRVIPAAVP